MRSERPQLLIEEYTATGLSLTFCSFSLYFSFKSHLFFIQDMTDSANGQLTILLVEIRGHGHPLQTNVCESIELFRTNIEIYIELSSVAGGSLLSLPVHILRSIHLDTNICAKTQVCGSRNIFYGRLIFFRHKTKLFISWKQFAFLNIQTEILNYETLKI